MTNFVISKIPFHFVRCCWYRKVMKYRLSPSSSVHLGVRFDQRGGLTVGPNSTVNPFCRLDTRGGIFIGRNVSISEDVSILTATHAVKDAAWLGEVKPVIINDFAWIGTRAMIMPGVVVGEGSVVGAGSVVTRDVPPFTVVAGAPARKIGNRETNLNYSAYYRRWFH